MDFVALDSLNMPTEIITGYDSLIYTERFNTVGDFMLVTHKVEETMSLLPENTRVSHLQTLNTCIVETHKIERPKGKPAKLTVTGRSFESVLDRRTAIQSVSSLTGDKDYVISANSPAQAAWKLIQDICVTGIINVADRFPLAQLFNQAPDATDEPFIRDFVIPRGNLLTRVLELVQSEGPGDPTSVPPTPPMKPFGIATRRPSPMLIGEVITGIIIQMFRPNDRSSFVYFDAGREQLDDGTYLFSKLGSANVGYGVGEKMAATMFEGDVEPTGLDRRVVLVDSTASNITDADVLRDYMSQELAAAKETAIFDGSINQDLIPYKYGLDYNLGDIVKIRGDYGLDELARVTEYIRTEDATGEKAYPTLSTIVA